MDPLNELKDIHLPPPISYWPPAYGWWILVLFIIIGVGFCIYLWAKKKRRTLAQRQALRMLERIDAQQEDWPKQLNSLLKRLALVYFAEKKVANLHGEDWRIFLANQLPAKKQADFNEQFSLLQAKLYRPAPSTPADFELCVRQVRLWITTGVPPNLKAQLQDNQPDV